MFGTFATSIIGVAIYSVVPFYNGQPAPTDWLLGMLFGVGGLLGMYLGASCQRYVKENYSGYSGGGDFCSVIKRYSAILSITGVGAKQANGKTWKVTIPYF